ncbi:hypothetical protein [Pelobacter seleniigenes]|uniref:hypothetical protein n=1 Tax=Pelobacter seleniigenes TaxID=407188 RepID=UPI0004A76F06|nr:hypothetical protein [Pelobacter seleniigenes]
MKWQDLNIGLKLTIGFGIMLILILAGGIVGYSGLKSVGHSMTVISDEEAPVVDASMEMKISLMEAMASMDEFHAALRLWPPWMKASWLPSKRPTCKPPGL